MKKIEKSFSNVGNRKLIRDNLIKEFLNEEPGSEEKTSQYRYVVENLSDNDFIYLQRPGPFNKGIDFIIYTDNTDFSNGIGRRRRNPKHSDILEDLKQKNNESPEQFLKIKSIINDIYNCVSDINIDEINKLKFESGFSVELILKIIKWMFIEQDITYWNYSGRKKLKKEIDKIG